MKRAIEILLLLFCLALLKYVVVGDPTVYYSSSVYYGNGAFRTYLSQENDVPQTIGVEFSATFFYDIPIVIPVLMNGVNMTMVDVDLPLPDEAPVYTPFQSVTLIHSGPHAPPYNKTHFDIFFFFQSEALRTENITMGTSPKVCGPYNASPGSWCSGRATVAKGCCPGGYGNGGSVIAAVGGAINDLQSPERLPATNPNHGPWIGAFGFGTFNSRITSYKMLVSFETFESFANGTAVSPRYCSTLRLPSEMPNVGYYPSAYCIYLTSGGNLRFEYNTFLHYATAGCKEATDSTSNCALTPPAQPTKDYLKYCQCS